MKYCLDCKNPKSRKGNYCKKCGYKHRTRPKGLNYILHKENPTSFKKGQKPWNKNTHGLYSEEYLKKMSISKLGKHFSTRTEFKKGMKSWNKGLEWKEMQNENHPNWKGNEVGYTALHSWIKKRFKKPNECQDCGIATIRLDLANISQEYKRDISDWKYLCRKCHNKFDNIPQKGWKTRKEKKWLAV